MKPALFHRTEWADPHKDAVFSGMPVLARIRQELIARAAGIPVAPPKKRRYTHRKTVCQKP